jgi:hypothetical protein
MSQKAEILAHLKLGKSLTPLEALRMFGCLRLAARISEIRDIGLNEGFTVKTESYMVRDRNGDAKPVARYVLEYNGQR